MRHGEGTIAPRETTLALSVLHGLTAQSGGIVAAATTSLPERSRHGRNYDYRYAWMAPAHELPGLGLRLRAADVRRYER